MPQTDESESPMKAIYGCVQSALLWYQLFYKHLKDLGFKLNPYDLYVTNT